MVRIERCVPGRLPQRRLNIGVGVNGRNRLSEWPAPCGPAAGVLCGGLYILRAIKQWRLVQTAQAHKQESTCHTECDVL
jgi:hypothetical protein